MVTHGVDGWSLVKYSWSEKREEGTFVYERRGKTQTVVRAQPLMRFN